jgi:hypothetical protein
LNIYFNNLLTIYFTLKYCPLIITEDLGKLVIGKIKIIIKAKRCFLTSFYLLPVINKLKNYKAFKNKKRCFFYETSNKLIFKIEHIRQGYIDKEVNFVKY